MHGRQGSGEGQRLSPPSGNLQPGHGRSRALLLGLGLALGLLASTGRAAPPALQLPPLMKSLPPGDPLGATWAASPPLTPPLRAPFLDPAAVKPGMKVVGYTAFEGPRIEPFVGTVVGTARGLIGPQRDALIVRFEDDRMKHVGIVHGMSGSPIYLSGYLLGALSLALSPFPKDALGGVTPILYMLDEAELLPSSQASRSRLEPPLNADGPARVSLFSDRSRQVGEARALERPGPAVSLASGTSAPLFPAPVWGAWGIDPDLLQGLEPFLGAAPRLLSGPVMSGSSGPAGGAAPPMGTRSAGNAPGPTAGGATLDGATTTPDSSVQATGADLIQPGAPIAAILVEGDASISATGTTTWRQGDMVLAFGHPFLSMGRMSLPMATAEVITTVADQTYPYKLANVGVKVGTMRADRVTAVVGQLGPSARLIPVTVRLKQAGQAAQTFQYRIAEDRELAPALYQLVLNASLRKQWRLIREGLYQVECRIRLSGGRELNTRSAWTFVKGSTSTIVFDVVDSLSDTLSALVLNPFEPVTVEGIEVSFRSTPEELQQQLVSLSVPSPRVKPGAVVPVSILLRQHLGKEERRVIEVPIPEGLSPGALELKVQDFRTAEADPVSGRPELSQARSLDALLGMLERSWTAGRLYLRLERKASGARVRHQVLPGLPSSVLKVLELSASSEVATVIEQEVLWQSQLELSGTVLGSDGLVLDVLPHP